MQYNYKKKTKKESSIVNLINSWPSVTDLNMRNHN